MQTPYSKNHKQTRKQGNKSCHIMSRESQIPNEPLTRSESSFQIIVVEILVDSEGTGKPNGPKTRGMVKSREQSYNTIRHHIPRQLRRHKQLANHPGLNICYGVATSPYSLNQDKAMNVGKETERKAASRRQLKTLQALNSCTRQHLGCQEPLVASPRRGGELSAGFVDRPGREEAFSRSQ